MARSFLLNYYRKAGFRGARSLGEMLDLALQIAEGQMMAGIGF